MNEWISLSCPGSDAFSNWHCGRIYATILVNCTFSLCFSEVPFNKMQMGLFESCLPCIYGLLLPHFLCRCVSLSRFGFYFLCLLAKWKHMDSLFGPSRPYRIESPIAFLTHLPVIIQLWISLLIPQWKSCNRRKFNRMYMCPECQGICKADGNMVFPTTVWGESLLVTVHSVGLEANIQYGQTCVQHAENKALAQLEEEDAVLKGKGIRGSYLDLIPQ